MRVALIHYWLVRWRGGEQVFKEIADLFPDADIYTHVADRKLIDRYLPGRHVAETIIGRLPFAKRLYQKYVPLMPLALEQLDMRGYDLIISSESGPAKGIIADPGTMHVCYCHSPMRYAWDMYHEYRAQAGWLTRAMMVPFLHYLRLWDHVAAQRVDHFVANSRFVARRIEKYYRRRAEVIHPPVAVDDFQVSEHCEDFYLAVGQLVPYKRPDLLVDAFNESGRRLVIIGHGAMLSRLRRSAKPNISMLGWQPAEVIRDHYARCRALIFPGIEDFGIVPIEAMACGKPVIAFAAGGVLETVVEGLSGIFFAEQTAASLNNTLTSFESRVSAFDALAIRRHAEQFSSARFRREFHTYIKNLGGLDEDAPGS